MILKGNARGGASNLAGHLLKTADNEHVEIHELRGFAADDLHGAFQEAYAISRGTRCRKFLFSLSLNPPENEDVPVEAFEAAIEEAESRLGLDDQPRAVVFHEKEGRRHAHAVWSRIDAEAMKAIPLPHYKRKLNTLARELYLEHGWTLPPGFEKGRTRNPLNFTQAEWQQAKRVEQDPRAIKALFRDCWAGSDTGAAFTAAMKERGYTIAQGDRRGFVAMDWRGEVYSISRYAGVKTKDLKARLGDPKDLRSVEQAKARLSQRMSEKLKAWIKEREAQAKKKNLALEFQREQMVQRHRAAREKLRRKQETRAKAEAQKRAEKTPRGVRGLWAWVTGRSRKIKMQNALEMQKSEARDRDERQNLITRQLAERRKLQSRIKKARERQEKAVRDLNRDVARYMALGRNAPLPKPHEKEAKRSRVRRAEKDRTHEREPDFEL